MQETNPLFSICIPAHNALATIGEALTSVAIQTFDSWEIIVVDDASTDELGSWIGAQDIIPRPKLRYQRLDENMGPFYARKVAFAEAQGDYVLCLDSDDAFIGNKALERLAAIAGDFHADVIQFNAALESDGHYPWIDFKADGLYPGYIEKERFIEVFISTYDLNNLSTKAIRKELLSPVCLDMAKGLKMCEDRLEAAGAILKANSFYLLDDPLYFYRENPDSTTHKKFEGDFCHQQAYIESSIAELFRGYGNALGRQKVLFLRLWSDDMRSLAHGHSCDELLGCYTEMQSELFFRDAVETVGTECLRLDQVLLISLLYKGRLKLAVCFAKILSWAKLISAKA